MRMDQLLDVIPFVESDGEDEEIDLAPVRNNQTIFQIAPCQGESPVVDELVPGLRRCGDLLLKPPSHRTFHHGPLWPYHHVDHRVDGMYAAVRANDMNLILQLLEKYEEHEKPPYGTPLHLAIAFKVQQAVMTLIEGPHGKQFLFERDAHGNTIFHVALIVNESHIIRYLFTHFDHFICWTQQNADGKKITDLVAEHNDDFVKELAQQYQQQALSNFCGSQREQ